MPNQYSKINNVSLVILAIVATTAALIYLRPVFVPFAFSIFIYSALAPLLEWLQGHLKLSRLIAVFITSVLFLGASTLLIILVSFSLEDFVASFDVYKSKIVEFFNDLLTSARAFGLPVSEAQMDEHIRELPLLNFARSLTGGVFGVLSNVLLVIIFVIFFLAGEGEIDRNREGMLREVQRQISQYLRVKFVVSLLTGFLVWILLFSFQIDLAFMFAVLTFLLNFIPNVGSIVATLLPLPVVLLQYGFGWEFVVILSIAGSLQFMIGNFLEPKWLGGSLNLHPISVLFFLLFWGLVWGIPGMFLSVPITAFMKILFERIETTRPLASLLSGKIPNEYV